MGGIRVRVDFNKFTEKANARMIKHSNALLDDLKFMQETIKLDKTIFSESQLENLIELLEMLAKHPDNNEKSS